LPQAEALGRAVNQYERKKDDIEEHDPYDVSGIGVSELTPFAT
jgi:hypothetical protein